MKARDQHNYPLRLNEHKKAVFLAAKKDGKSVNEFILSILKKELKLK